MEALIEELSTKLSAPGQPGLKGNLLDKEVRRNRSVRQERVGIAESFSSDLYRASQGRTLTSCRSARTGTASPSSTPITRSLRPRSRASCIRSMPWPGSSGQKGSSSNRSRPLPTWPPLQFSRRPGRGLSRPVIKRHRAASSRWRSWMRSRRGRLPVRPGSRSGYTPVGAPDAAHDQSSLFAYRSAITSSPLAPSRVEGVRLLSRTLPPRSGPGRASWSPFVSCAWALWWRSRYLLLAGRGRGCWGATCGRSS